MQTYIVILANGAQVAVSAPCPPMDVSGTLVFYEAAGQGQPASPTGQAIATFTPGWLGWVNQANQGGTTA